MLAMQSLALPLAAAILTSLAIVPNGMLPTSQMNVACAETIPGIAVMHNRPNLTILSIRNVGEEPISSITIEVDEGALDYVRIRDTRLSAINDTKVLVTLPNAIEQGHVLAIYLKWTDRPDELRNTRYVVPLFRMGEDIGEKSKIALQQDEPKVLQATHMSIKAVTITSDVGDPVLDPSLVVDFKKKLDVAANPFIIDQRSPPLPDSPLDYVGEKYAICWWVCVISGDGDSISCADSCVRQYDYN
jgi:hypothetical protein